MSIWRLVIKEILHRKLNFGLGLLSVVVASACMVGALTLLRRHDIRTAQIIALKEAETTEKMRKLQDDYRKIMKKLGFNLLILPKDQDVGDLYADGYVSQYMPEEYVNRLAQSRIMLVRHLLPILQQRLKWPEKQRTIVLTGVRGEVPLIHRTQKEAMLDPVPAGSMVVGYELARSLKLSVADKVTLLGRQFTISKCYPERGNKDDITVWINLEQAQELLDKAGKINGIMALQCFCPVDNMAEVRSEITGILPDVRVIELGGKVLIRAEARQTAKVAARQAIEAEKKNRALLRGEIETLAAVLVPLVIVGCALWIGFLAFSNVRERRSEIGILRAFGMRARQILIIFLSKAILMGLFGVILGCLIGFVVGTAWGPAPLTTETFQKPFDPTLFFLVLVLFPVLSGLAGWIPAVIAAQQDPVIVLRQE